MENQANEIEILKSYLKDYLEKFTNYYNPSKQYGYKIICRNPDHNESRPSMSFNPKSKKYLHCFSCQANYSIIDLVIMDFNLGDPEIPLSDRLKDKATINLACNKIKELFNLSGTITSKKESDPIEKIDNTPILEKEILKHEKGYISQAQKDYLDSRGLTDLNLIIKLGIKTIPTDKGAYLSIPYQISDPIKTLTERLFISKQEITKDMRYKHFGEMTTYDPFNYLNSDDPRIIFISEGEIDTISYYQAFTEIKAEGFQSSFKYGAIGLGGMNNFKDLISRLSSINKNDLYFVLALDNETDLDKIIKVKKASDDLALAFRDNNIKYVITLVIDSKYKDANEYLVNDKESFKASIKNTITNIKELYKETQKDLLDRQEQEIQEERKKYINADSCLGLLNDLEKMRINPIRPSRTYFPELDSVLKGGLREGVITIGALSSLGKTSFVLQIADQIAQSQKRDITIFSLEMAKEELIAKSLSRIMYQEARAKKQDFNLVKSQSEILSPINWEGLSEALYSVAVNSYKTFASHLYIREGFDRLGVKEIRSMIEDQISKTNKTPIIIIDYLQILASEDKNLGDKQRIDSNMTALKHLSRDLHTTIILISSLNRSSYSIDVNMASFKESGSIEYGSDIIIGLNYHLTDDERERYKKLIKDLRTENKDLPESEKRKIIDDFEKNIRNKTPRNIKLDILKNRSGEYNKSINYLFYPQYNYFIEDYQKDEDLYKILKYSKDHDIDQEDYLPF